MTVGFVAGSINRAGGSHGGLGGASSGGSANAVYGDFRDPDNPGSGGGRNTNSGGGNGGGLARIVAGTVQLDGFIRADGVAGQSGEGGGSGGGIRIDVGTLQGTGTISANGGDGNGGSGGRIAVYYQDVTGFDLTKINAFGGVWVNGGAGTIYLQGPGRATGELILDNNNVTPGSRSTPIPSDPSGLLALTNLRVRQAARVKVDDQLNITGTLEATTGGEFIPASRVIASTININNGGVITQLPTTNSAFFKLDLTANSLIVDTTGKINVTGRGFLGAGQPGNPFTTSGMTVDFVAGSTGSSGGSYGGVGAGSSPNPFYGNSTDPNEVGSGGGRQGNPAGGNGGGLVRLVSGTIQLDGIIAANGADGGPFAGGGSGGGIRIDVGTLQGTGTISANGGSANGGGGGRVAVYFQDITGFNVANITASGGPGAGNGTVFQQQFFAQWVPTEGEAPIMKAEVTDKPVRPGSRSTPIPSDPSGLLALTNLRVRQAARVKVDDQLNITGTLEATTGGEFIPASRVIASTININNGGVITQLPTTNSAFFKLDLTANSLIVDTTGKINVTGRGFLGAGQPGNPFTTSGMTVDFVAGSTGSSGGSYGGVGAGSSPNPFYGNSTDPNEVGSGGGRQGNPAGGNGGGSQG